MKRRDFILGATSSAGVLLLDSAKAATPCAPVLGGATSSIPCPAGDAEADWLSRISGPGVIWYHDFRNEAEVDAFRWSDGYGQDPDDVPFGTEPAPNAGFGKYVSQNSVNWVQGDGITGDACLEILRHSGTTETCTWWRPMTPVNNTGRGNADPAASGTLPVKDWDPYDRTLLWNWTGGGYYGHPSYHAAWPGQFDGTEYYFQCRVKVDARRRVQMPVGGKMFYFSLTKYSASNQEIVVMSKQNEVLGTDAYNVFDMYRSIGPSLWGDTAGGGQQPGSDYGFCNRLSGNIAGCWYWPDNEWVTIQWHIVPGLNSNSDTVVRVWIAEQGQTSYTKIWDQTTVDLPYDSLYPDTAPGHNAVLCSGYTNGFDMSEFYQRYDQLIFSKDFIPCPQV